MQYQQLRYFPWNGSKRWLIPEISKISAQWSGTGRYFEPFVGGGHVSHLIRQQFPDIPQVLNDANKWLASAYQWQINQQEYQLPDNFHAVEYWRNLRDDQYAGLSLSEQVTRMAVCIFSSWGHRWQTYEDGRLRSTLDPQWCTSEYLRSKILPMVSQRWLNTKDQVLQGDWKDALAGVQPGDLVFLDPPYTETLGYGNQRWGVADQIDVWEKVESLSQLGVSVIVTNHEEMSRLYRRFDLGIKILDRPGTGTTSATRKEMLGWTQDLNPGIPEDLSVLSLFR